MIVLYNPNTNNPFSVQYVKDSQVFRKEILPNYLVGFRNLTGATQIINSSSLMNEGISIFDPINNIVTNLGSYTTGYTGFVVQSGLTLTTALLTTPTGYTFITSASTGTLANNSATATTVGNSIRIGYSGSSVSTTTWLAAINTTAFSGMGITVAGASSSIFINSGASITLSLTANTFSSNVGSTLFVGDNVKREAYVSASAFSATTAFNSLNTLITT